jgi:hypothetical protein
VITSVLQGLTDIKNAFSVQFIEHVGGRAVFTLSVPEEIFPFIKNLLENSASVITWLMTKNRVDKAISKAQDSNVFKEQEQLYIKRRDRILVKFDSFVSSGSTHRIAMKQTKEFFNNEMTCYQIELMARETGRLSKRRE